MLIPILLSLYLIINNTLSSAGLPQSHLLSIVTTNSLDTHYSAYKYISLHTSCSLESTESPLLNPENLCKMLKKKREGQSEQQSDNTLSPTAPSVPISTVS